jgi:hypothetical protein
MSVIGLVACNNGSSTPMPTPKTVTKDVTAKAIPVSVGVACVSIDFAPDTMLTPEGGWDDNFKATDVTYKLSDDKGHSTDKGDFTGGVVNASLYEDGDTPIITQVFYYADKEVGRRAVALNIVKSSMAGSNAYIGDLLNTELTDTVPNIPAVSLSLSK